jgi:hypothetical protein
LRTLKQRYHSHNAFSQSKELHKDNAPQRDRR